MQPPVRLLLIAIALLALSQQVRAQDFGQAVTVANGLVAGGTTQATASLIRAKANNFATVSLGAGVMLPSIGSAGVQIAIQNSSANTLLVYPPIGGVINNLGVDTPYALLIGSGAQFTSLSTPAGATFGWILQPYGTGAGSAGPVAAITSGNISGTAISGNSITSGTITSAAISGSSISGGTEAGVASTNGSFTNPAITGGTALNLALTGGTSTSQTITTATLSNPSSTGGTFTTPALVNGTMASPAITGGTINSAAITGGTITGATISDFTISLSGQTIDSATITGGTITGSNATGALTLATGGTTSRTLGARAADALNIIDFGADMTGTSDSAATIAAAVTATNASGATLLLTPGTLNLSTNVFFGPATVDSNRLSTSTPLGQRIHLSPQLTQTGAGALRFDNLIPGGPPPVFMLDYLGKAYGPSYNTYANIYQQTIAAQQNGTTAQVVAFAPWAVLNSDTGSAWAMNPNCLVTYSSPTPTICYGQEVDVGTVAYTAASASAGTIAGTVFTPAGTITGTFNYGQVLAGTGVTTNTRITTAGTVTGTWNIDTSQTVTATSITGSGANVHTYGVDVHGFGIGANYIGYRITANGASNAFQYGTVLNAASFTPITGTMFLISGTHYQSATGFDISSGAFTTAEWTSPNLYVGSTIATNGGALGATGARIGVAGSAVASGNPLPTIFPKLGSGETSSDLGIMATGGVIRLETGTVAGPRLQVEILDTASATNALTLTGGTNPTISTTGGTVTIGTTIQGAVNAQFTNVYSGFGQANQIEILGSNGTNALTIKGISTSSIALALQVALAGNVEFGNVTSGYGLTVTDPGSAVTNIVTVKGGTASSNPIISGGTAANLVLGQGVALTSSASAGFPAIPTIAAVPTGTTGGVGQAAIMINTISHKLCHSEGGGVWYDATGAACS